MPLLSLVGICPRGKHFPELVLERARAIMRPFSLGHASAVYQPRAQIVFKTFTCCYNTWVRLPSFLFCTTVTCKIFISQPEMESNAPGSEGAKPQPLGHQEVLRTPLIESSMV